MLQSYAINLAKNHAAEWAVPWRQIMKSERMLPWWFFFGQSYDFTIDTGDGEAVASVVSGLNTVTRFEYHPWDPKAFLLPLWAAFPLNDSVTMSWRMGGYDERYKYRWHYFYRALSNEAKAEYRQKYPPPEDERRCWRGFYEFIADKPASGDIVDFVIGRVP
jgi:hypothetical protein